MKIYRQLLLQALFLLLTTLVIPPNTFSQDYRVKDSVEAFEIRNNLLSIENNQKNDQNPSNIRKINFFQHYTMFCIPIYRSIVSGRMNGDSVIIGEEVLKEWITYHYYVYKNDKSSGMKYDSISAVSGKPFDVDSLLKKSGFSITVDTNEYAFTNAIILSNGDLVKKYGLKGISIFADSMYCFYNNSMKNLNYTFSKKMDTVSNMKLYRVVAIFDSMYKTKLKDGQKPGIPRELYYELVSTRIENRNEIQSLFERYKKDIGEK